MSRDYRIAVEISHITEKQAQEFVALFGWMNKLGYWGSSRQATLFYDGDGGARARITVNGELATTTGKIDDLNFDFE